MWTKEEVVKELKNNGKRITEQRKILIEIILENQWNTCKEIYYEAHKRDASVGIATVYRMMDTLQEIGVLGSCSRYQLMSAR